MTGRTQALLYVKLLEIKKKKKNVCMYVCMYVSLHFVALAYIHIIEQTAVILPFVACKKRDLF